MEFNTKRVCNVFFMLYLLNAVAKTSILVDMNLQEIIIICVFEVLFIPLCFVNFFLQCLVMPFELFISCLYTGELLRI